MWCPSSCLLLFTLNIIHTLAKIDSGEDTRESDDHIENSEERIGASVTQVSRHPYAASLLKNDTYICSAVVLNTYWLLTLTKCFDPNMVASYVTYRNLSSYTIRTGSSYNNKGGNISKIKMLISSIDIKVSAVKITSPLVFNDQVGPVTLPSPDDEVALGYLASMIAWTPTGHIRIINVPIIDPNICVMGTRLVPRQFICVGGVQDPNRHFCRRDNGGAILQNNKLMGISMFVHTCALYTKTHKFPKIPRYLGWLHSTIWDEEDRPTTYSTTMTTEAVTQTTNSTEAERNLYVDPQKYMLTLPFAPVNVPLEPAQDNSVIPRMSMYESYLQNLARVKTTTTNNPNSEEARKAWLQKYGKALLMMPPRMFPKVEQFGYE